METQTDGHIFIRPSSNVHSEVMLTAPSVCRPRSLKALAYYKTRKGGSTLQQLTAVGSAAVHWRDDMCGVDNGGTHMSTTQPLHVP